ncbi:MAG: hypothetical protein AB4042_17780 [Leptolyngbyaceae cyanobacterium]
MNIDLVVLNLMGSILRWLVALIQPILVPLCCLTAWLLLAIACWGLWSALHRGIAQARRMHQIPCSNCQFFTGNYLLKCTVRPDIALSEAAISCSDYAATVCGLSSVGRYRE